MGSRAPLRFASVALALLRWGVLRRQPAAPRRILVLHHLLLGDTLMCTALLAKLRERHPAAEIAMTVPRAYAPLYQGRPYGVTALPFDPRDFATFRGLLALPRFDLAILPADNRWSWLARALGVRWIVAIASDRPAYKNWPVDEAIPYSAAPAAFCETAAALVPGAAPAPYHPSQWPAPGSDARSIGGDFAVLHVGASSPLKLWAAERWRALAAALEEEGLAVVWSAGPGEGAILDGIDASSPRARIAGTLSLAQLWHVLARAQLLVCPDTGIAHLGRVIGVPTVTLFGPGSALICGPGDFFAAMPGRAVTVDPFPCRDQTIQFFREVPWARRCERLFGDGPGRCPRARCMEAIEVADVLAAARAVRTRPLPFPVPRG
ncbi:MAG: glycosyltransferase family 9 protein [Burkholderiales bacterium]|nr:glycosyltransferase family 9 protein [Burkholderiales bacterium]